jgi:hypothetical protein
MTRGMPEKMTKAQMIGAAFLLVVMGILGGISFGDEIPQKSQQISEDDPGWDCHTMGNRICGN